MDNPFKKARITQYHRIFAALHDISVKMQLTDWLSKNYLEK